MGPVNWLAVILAAVISLMVLLVGRQPLPQPGLQRRQPAGRGIPQPDLDRDPVSVDRDAPDRPVGTERAPGMRVGVGADDFGEAGGVHGGSLSGFRDGFDRARVPPGFTRVGSHVTFGLRPKGRLTTRNVKFLHSLGDMTR